jgi:hypothetical protein
MGNCGSSGHPESYRSKQIDKQIKADEKMAKTEVKLLLLGTYCGWGFGTKKECTVSRNITVCCLKLP